MNRGESPASSQGASFTDIGESSFRDAIVRCCRRGWFLGVAVTRFGPSRPMTRGMLAAVLHRAAGLFPGCKPPRLLRGGGGLVRLPGIDGGRGKRPVFPGPVPLLGGAGSGAVALEGKSQREKRLWG